MVVHDLDLNHLGRDMFGFDASHYHEHWYRSKTPNPMDDMFQDLFTARRNRVEYIDDFPMDDEPNMVPSLEVCCHSSVLKLFGCMCSKKVFLGQLFDRVRLIKPVSNVHP